MVKAIQVTYVHRYLISRILFDSLHRPGGRPTWPSGKTVSISSGLKGVSHRLPIRELREVSRNTRTDFHCQRFGGRLFSNV
jgi:hypothetical protein